MVVETGTIQNERLYRVCLKVNNESEVKGGNARLRFGRLDLKTGILITTQGRKYRGIMKSSDFCACALFT